MTKILRMAAVKDKTGLSRASIYVRMSNGTFPKSISLGANSVGWLEAEINDWIEAKISARDSQQNAA